MCGGDGREEQTDSEENGWFEGGGRRGASIQVCDGVNVIKRNNKKARRKYQKQGAFLLVCMGVSACMMFAIG